MCINNGYGVLPFVRFFLDLKSHEGFSVVFFFPWIICAIDQGE